MQFLNLSNICCTIGNVESFYMHFKSLSMFKALTVDSVLEIPLKRKLALRFRNVKTYSENKLLLESFFGAYK